VTRTQQNDFAKKAVQNAADAIKKGRKASEREGDRLHEGGFRGSVKRNLWKKKSNPVVAGRGGEPTLWLK